LVGTSFARSESSERLPSSPPAVLQVVWSDLSGDCSTSGACRIRCGRCGPPSVSLLTENWMMRLPIVVPSRRRRGSTRNECVISQRRGVARQWRSKRLRQPVPEKLRREPAVVGGSRTVRPESPPWLNPLHSLHPLPVIYKQAFAMPKGSIGRIYCEKRLRSRGAGCSSRASFVSSIFPLTKTGRE
jgi:hypothetical protein